MVTFKGSRVIISVIIVIAVFLILGIIDSSQEFEQVVFIAILLPLVFLIYWFTGVEITIDSVGIQSKSRKGKKEIRWEDVTRFTYAATSERLNFIPMGTYYSLKLEDIHGVKIHITNRVSGLKSLASELIHRTTPPLLQKVTDQFNSGTEVDFGSIKLSKNRGLISEGLFKQIEVPLNENIVYCITKGKFRVFRPGKWIPAISTPIKKVPNVFALMLFLDLMFERNEPSFRF